MNTVLKILKRKSVLYSISIEPYQHPNTKFDRRGFVIHFHRRRFWSVFGFKKSINSSYYLKEGQRAFKIFQLVESKGQFTSFHMHSKNNWMVSFIISCYAEGHV